MITRANRVARYYIIRISFCFTTTLSLSLSVIETYIYIYKNRKLFDRIATTKTSKNARRTHKKKVKVHAEHTHTLSLPAPSLSLSLATNLANILYNQHFRNIAEMCMRKAIVTRMQESYIIKKHFPCTNRN